MRALTGLAAITALLAASGCRSLAIQRLPDQVLPGAPILRAQLQRTERGLRRALHVSADSQQLRRDDGFIYTIDVAHLLVYATLYGDSALYHGLRTLAIRHLVSDSAADPFTSGFVRWRYRPGTPADASGTTEGLGIAEGLWRGGAVFGDSAGMRVALLILRGYARHAYSDQGTWYIRNYFNMQTRAFATNSFIVDYDPDFVNTVASATRDSTLIDLATRSYDVIGKAVAPSGLLYEVIQPELVTALPGLASPFFGPNDIVSLLNSCTVAERVVEGRPAVARRILEFARSHDREHAIYYYGRSSEPVHEDDLRSGPIACLVRLAIKLGDLPTRDMFLRQLVDYLGPIVRSGHGLDVSASTEVLLALQMAIDSYAR